MDYVATMRLRPVTDGDRTFIAWECRFDPPPEQAAALSQLVAEAVYDAGFEALRRHFRSADTAGLGQRPNRATNASEAAAGAAVATQAIVVRAHGGPEVLAQGTIDVPPPSRGEVRIRQEAIGVNFIDVHCRDGSFGMMALPGVPGVEAAGVVVDVGTGLDRLAQGDRVVYASATTGAYAGYRTLPADEVVLLPPDIPARAAAAFYLKGMMADILATDVHPSRPGEIALVRAAAGGVGLLLVGMLKGRGVTVIGVVSSEAKATAARAAGCDRVIVGTGVQIAEAVAAASGGRGADVVFDGLGRDSFEGSLSLLAMRGHLVAYGQATGPIGTFDIDRLARRSLTLSRPSFGHFAGSPEALEARAARVFAFLRTRPDTLVAVAILPLRNAAEAHRSLASRRSVGSIVLIPGELP